MAKDKDDGREEERSVYEERIVHGMDVGANASDRGHAAPGCHLNDVRKKKKEAEREKIMVCVTRQMTCERLIHYGAELAEQMGADLLVAHATRPDEPALGNADEAQALEMLSALTFQHGGEMCMLRAEDVFEGLAGCARKNGVELMIMGSSPEKAEPVSRRMRELLPKINLIVLDAEGEGQGRRGHAKRLSYG